MLTDCIQKLIQKQDLNRIECQEALNEILHSENNPQIAAFLVLLHAKRETAEEVEGIVCAMRNVMNTLPVNEELLDIVGTGGDGANTVNISTAASILAASCGARVAKHGNRSVSSQCGSADLLEALGVAIDISPESVANCINELGIGFCFAPNFHPAMKKIKKIREELGIRTTFNMLGPLLNPAKAQHYLMGVFSEQYMDLLADVLLNLKVKHALVVHGCGLDELSTLGPAQVIEVTLHGKHYYSIDPKQFGFQYCQLQDLQGGDPNTNANLIKDAFSGKPSPIADTIALNAGVALYVADLVATIDEGVASALDHLKRQKAMHLLNNWVTFSKTQGGYHA